MTIKSAMRGIMAIAALLVPNTAFASLDEKATDEQLESGFYNEYGGIKYTKDRPAINPDFVPDEDISMSRSF